MGKKFVSGENIAIDNFLLGGCQSTSEEIGFYEFKKTDDGIKPVVRHQNG